MSLFHIIPMGEFEHHSGIIQVIDQQAVDSMYNNYSEELFLTVDHLPHYNLESTRSYGWIKNIEKKDDGVWANIELTVLGSDAIDNKLFKWFSPEFKVSNLEHIEDNKYRPIKVSGLSLTNEPNMASPNAVPIFNAKEYNDKGLTHIMVEIMNNTQEEVIQEVLDEVKDIIEEVLTEEVQSETVSEVVAETPVEEVQTEESVEELTTEETPTTEDAPVVEEQTEESVAQEDTSTDGLAVEDEEDIEDKCDEDKWAMLKNSINKDFTDTQLFNHLKSLHKEDLLNKASKATADVETLLNSFTIPSNAKDKWKEQLLNNREQTEELLNATFEKKSLVPDKPVSKYSPKPLEVINTQNTTKELFNKAVAEYQKENNVNYTMAFNAVYKSQGHLLK